MNLDHYKHLHNKGILVDGHTVVVTSTNWSNNSVAFARETGLIIRSKDVAGYYAKAFERDWKNGLDPDDAIRELTRALATRAFGEPGDFIEASEGV